MFVVDLFFVVVVVLCLLWICFFVVVALLWLSCYCAIAFVVVTVVVYVNDLERTKFACDLYRSYIWVLDLDLLPRVRCEVGVYERH